MFQRRTIILAVCFALLFIAELCRLAELQIFSSENYRQQGEMRRHRLKQVPPSRGRILDRMGEVLAEDVAAYELWLVPARQEENKQKKNILSGQLGELTPERLLEISGSVGPQRELEQKLALTYLVESWPLTKKLSLILKRDVNEIAKTILDAALDRNEASIQSLTQARPCLQNVPLAAYLEIMQAKGNPYAEEEYGFLEPRLGFKRVYPTAGPELAHVVGVCSPLTEKEYLKLRGRWNRDGTKEEGSGIIKDSNTQVFFQIEPGSQEESIIELKERQRAGQVERYAGYFGNEMVGRTGVEQYYNQKLRGRHRLQLQKMERPDAKGSRRFVNEGEQVAPDNGEDLVLTIDSKLQKKVRDILVEALRNYSKQRKMKLEQGVCVLMNPQNGQIYALVSEPTFDPNTYRKDYPRLLADPAHPLINLAISGTFPPGSSIKPTIALGALNDHKITPDTTFDCEGVEVLGGVNFICMRRYSHGYIEVTEALKKSCNIFFYHTGAALGARGIHEWARQLSFGHPTGIDLTGESGGLLPERAYTGKGWSLGETYHFSIGQGAFDVTPLQIAVATAVIANGGKVVRPHVRYDPNDPTLNEPLKTLNLNEQALATVRKGMWRVVNEVGGTACRLGRISKMEYGGKTGSAQHTKGTHAWFTSFAPFEKPEVVCVVLVPLGNHGGETCAPIVRKVLEAYFEITPEEEEKVDEATVKEDD